MAGVGGKGDKRIMEMFGPLATSVWGRLGMVGTVQVCKRQGTVVIVRRGSVEVRKGAEWILGMTGIAATSLQARCQACCRCAKGGEAVLIVEGGAEADS